MIRIPKLTARQVLIVLHDLLATMAAIVVTFLMRFEDNALAERLRGLEIFLPFFLVYAAVVYFILGLHRNKWRFTSIPDLYNLFRASTVLAISLLALDYVLVAPNFYGTFFFGKVTILLYWFLQMFFLGGLRVVYRYFHYARTLQRVKVADATPTLVLGRAADAEVLLRGIESGAVKKIWPVGVLSPSAADRGQSIRGIPVLGDIDDLEGVVSDLERRGDRVRRLVLAPSALTLEARPEAILIRARRLGLIMSQMPSLDTGGAAVQLSPVAVEDLLLRPSVKIDYRRLEDLVSGKAIVVTGGGGSIGSEICDRIVTFGAARLLVIEHSEPALHAVMESLEGQTRPGGDRWPHCRYSRPTAHHESRRPVQTRHGVSCCCTQARADARAGLGRRHQDQCFRLDERCRCGGGSRRDRHGDDFDRQGDRAGVRAGRYQASGGNVLPGSRR